MRPVDRRPMGPPARRPILAHTIALLVLAGTLAASPAAAAIRISGDDGGDMATYMSALENIRKSGQTVIIDGDCFSACTLVTAFIPPDRICVTSRARLGFHDVQTPDSSGAQADNPALSQALLAMYPDNIRSWLNRHGGITSRLVILSGRELRDFYRSCAQSER